MTIGPEFTEVEQPFIDQLVLMGWEHTPGSLEDPSLTGREGFREVLLLQELKAALYRINLDRDGKPWLDEGRIMQAVNALLRLGTGKLLEANRKATELLIKGTVVDGVEGWDQGRGRTVHFIDWDNLQNNSFRAINQFQVACPAGQSDRHIRPDIVLFVNGIPLVIVECKSPYAATPLEDAVNQLQRYANRRRDLGVVDLSEGNEQLFHYSQFVVATCGEQARAGTFSSLAVHFLEWKDTSPTPMAEVAAELGKAGAALTSQEKLVAGMLRPAHLLDIVRHFTLFMESGGRTVKLVCRYQQFRAVQLAIQRMLTGKTRARDGEQDRRGGIIWHTQGSGKSLTMVFLIRKMRSDPRLRRFKVVVVTDRRAKPIASSTRSAGISNSVPAMGCIFSSIRVTTSFFTLPLAPSNFVVITAKSRSAPSSCEDEVRNFSGQFGQLIALFSFSGGFGMISSCTTDKAPCRIDVPMQSDPVSPPPITTTRLPLARIGIHIIKLLFADTAVLLRQEIHGEMHAIKLASGNGQVAAFFCAASQNNRIILRRQFLHRTGDADIFTIVKSHAFLFHLRNAPVDQMFFHFEIRNAITQQTACLAIFFIHMHVMANARELLGCSKASRARANDRNGLARFCRRHLRLKSSLYFRPGQQWHIQSS